MDDTTRLALAAGGGDDEALERWVRSTQAEVWRLCAHLVERNAADDLTQETYARALSSLHRFEARSSARTWLLSIARRTCADEIRRRVRARRLSERVERAEQVALDTAATEEPGSPAALVELVDLLDADRREAFVLTQMLGLSYGEAAEVCGCPIGTIRSRVSRARGDLVDALDDARAEDGPGIAEVHGGR